ncbi:MAG TPA: DUF1294 domain-containing protein [Bacillales bacterium]|nr:DUF1294 domain-containing protein [Bacillales bacterium]
MLDLLWMYLIAVNVIGFIQMGYDKRQAKTGGRRTPEARLFLIALIGGSAGVYAGMKIWHHKTKHASFRIGIPLLFVVNLSLYVFFVLNFE